LLGDLTTDSFKVLKQYELNIPVSVVVLNGQDEGLTLGGSLGTQIASESGSVSFFAGDNVNINAGSFDAIAALVRFLFLFIPFLFCSLVCSLLIGATHKTQTQKTERNLPINPGKRSSVIAILPRVYLGWFDF